MSRRGTAANAKNHSTDGERPGSGSDFVFSSPQRASYRANRGERIAIAARPHGGIGDMGTAVCSKSWCLLSTRTTSRSFGRHETSRRQGLDTLLAMSWRLLTVLSIAVALALLLVLGWRELEPSSS